MSRTQDAIAFCEAIEGGNGVGDNDMTMARTLAEVDFSEGARLRHELIRRIERGAAPLAPDARAMLRLVRRPLPVAVAALVAALIVVQCAWLGGIRGLMIQIGESIKRAELGPNTRVTFLSDEEWAAEARSLPPADEAASWILPPLYLRGRGTGLPWNVDPTAQKFTNVRKALRAVEGFTPVFPRYTPPGWKLGLVVVPRTRDAMHVFYTYQRKTCEGCRPGWRTMIFEVRSHQRGDSYGLASNLPASRLRIGPIDAAWIAVQISPEAPDNTLIWEVDGQTIVLNMEASTLEEISQVAASVR